MKLIFMGTPDFAVPSLEILVNAGYDIVGVITSVDKYGGRGNKKLLQSAVKKYALSKKLNILQPPNLKNKAFQEELKALNADLQIVVAFRMLPVSVWDMPPLGTYNLHGSLLPKYRGAAPINWAIINGETETGVTSFKLKHEIDTGSIAIQKSIKIYENDSATDLHDSMKYIAAETVLETVQNIEADKQDLSAQKDELATHAPKLNNTNTIIDFSTKTKKVFDHIRGLSLYPCAWFNLEGKKMKIYKASMHLIEHNEVHGLIKSDNKNYVQVFCEDGYIDVKELQLSGKRKMSTKEFLNGTDLKIGLIANQ